MQDDDPGLDMVHLLRAITVQLDLFGAEFARRHGLNANDLRALIALLDAAREGRDATPGWLREQLGINSASVTVLIDRLERAGHIRRVRDIGDRRRVLLTVEDQAVALGWSFFGPLITRTLSTLQEFGDAEQDTIRRFLVSMSKVVTTDRQPDGTDPRADG